MNKIKSVPLPSFARRLLTLKKIDEVKRGIIILCPKSLVFYWETQINEYLNDLTVHVVLGKKIYKVPKANIYILNYNLLLSWVDNFALFSLLVLDQSATFSSHTKTKKAIEIMKIRNIRILDVQEIGN